MDYRLAIDLGTTSAGLVALALNTEGKPTGVLWDSLRIFPEPLKPGKSGPKPKKAARREARQMRTQIDRRARRLRRIAHLAPLLALDKEEPKPPPGPGIVDLRARAARERIELNELLLVMLRLAKGRGYKGEFRAVKKNSEAGIVQTGSGKLRDAMALLAKQRGVDNVTLGEYLHYRHHVLGLPIRMKLEREDADDLYPLRAMVEQEFETIWQTQAQHHPILTSDHQGRPIKDHFHDAIFFQRPLRSPAPLVGNCPLETNLPRAPRAQPAAQAFRIEKTIADLRWGMGRRATPLSQSQKTVLRALLNDPDRLRADGTIMFKAIYKELEKAGYPRPDSRGLNLERASREQLTGNTTLVTFKRLGLIDQWHTLDRLTQIQVINFLADLGSPEQLDSDDWYRNIRKVKATGNRPEDMRQFRPELVSFVNRLRSNEKFDRLSKMGFDGGRSAYSIKALEQLTDWMQNPPPQGDDDPLRIDEDAATRHCYSHRFKEGETKQRLSPAPLTGNDIVDGALRQLHKAINQCIEQLGGPPTEIIIETARELGAGAKRRKQWEDQAANNQKRNQDAAKKIAAAGEVASTTKSQRYQLWEEQEECCPYCVHKIGLYQALNGGETNFEHILPRNLTQVRRKLSELVLSHRACNTAKGDRTPWQAWGESDPQRWTQIEGRASRFEELGEKHYKKDRPLAMGYFRKAKLLLLKDYANEVMNDQSIKDFADRQLHQTSWIAKAATAWLGTICANVFASRGEMTAGLRAAWGLNTVIPEVRYQEGYQVFNTDGEPISQDDFALYRDQWEGRLTTSDAPRTDQRIDKRIDHRHHLIDALTIALTSRGLYQAMARRYIEQSEAIGRGEKKRRDWSIEPPLRNVRKVALKLIANCKPIHKPDRHPNGRFYEDTFYGTAWDGKSKQSCLTIRHKLVDLADKTLEKTRSKIQSIVSAEVRGIIADEFERRISEGMTPKAALSKPIRHPSYRNEIRKAKCFQKSGQGFLKADDAIMIVHRSRSGDHIKRVVSDSYACLDVTIRNGKLVEAHLVQLGQFRNYSKKPEGAIRFFKGDTVVDLDSGKRYLIHQFNIANGGSVFMAPAQETRPLKLLTRRDGRRKVSGRGLLRLRPEP